MTITFAPFKGTTEFTGARTVTKNNAQFHAKLVEDTKTSVHIGQSLNDIGLYHWDAQGLREAAQMFNAIAVVLENTTKMTIKKKTLMRSRRLDRKKQNEEIQW